MTAWKEAIVDPRPCNHLVQFYGDDDSLVQNVVQYLREGAERGEGMVVIATPAHRERFLQGLRGADELVRDGRLRLLDAQETLSRFLVAGEPDAAKFDAVVGQLLRELRSRAGETRIRAYGEMVDLLWKDGKLAAATTLEKFWNTLLATHRFALFCAYTVDLLRADGQPLLEMLSTHSHLLPVRTNGELEHAVDRAMTEVLGAQTVASLLPLVRANLMPRLSVPPSEAMVLWLRSNLPPYADAVLSRARAYYEEECARSSRAIGA